MRLARALKNMEQDEVASRLNVSQSLVSRMEKMESIPIEYIFRLDKIFGGIEWRTKRIVPTREEILLQDMSDKLSTLIKIVSDMDSSIHDLKDDVWSLKKGDK